MRKSYLPFAQPDLDHTELELIKEALDAGWVTTGPKTKQFEAEFAAAVSAGQAVALNSCTAAMHLALEAVGLQLGDEVITTPYTFAASAEVIRYFDARPVFVDICPDDFNIDPDLIQEAITGRTKAILPFTSVVNRPRWMPSIVSLCNTTWPWSRMPPTPFGPLQGTRDWARCPQVDPVSPAACLLLLLRHQNDHHRRRRHDHHQ